MPRRLRKVKPLKINSLIPIIALLLAAWILFLFNIQYPKTVNFDEFHYVPAAKQFLSLTKNQNWEHPPLAKELIAIGIAVFGDQPLGWRFMSTLFGVLTLAGMYVLALVIFEDAALAFFVALITLFNSLLYVQARIGMLDTFMMGFLVCGLVGFSAALKPRLEKTQIRKYLLAAGIMFGLTTACKWFGIIPWFACLALAALIALLRKWQVSFPNRSDQDWYEPSMLQGIGILEWAFFLGLVPAIFYFLTFIPFYFIKTEHLGFLDLFRMQKTMWEGQLSVGSTHPYMSTWKDWPLLGRPIWYAFDTDPVDKMVRGVLLLGNPVVMWGGLGALLLCFLGWIQKKERSAFLILIFYAALFGSWIVIPRKISFYYYYYPAGMILSLAIAYAIYVLSPHNRIVRFWLMGITATLCGAYFIYFFPILAALKIPPGSFTRWMWNQHWI